MLLEMQILKKVYMKGLSASIVKGLGTKSILTCIDNTGAKELEIISVRGFKGKRRTKPRAGVGDQVTCRVKRGVEKVRHEVFKVVIVRQAKEYRRFDGTRISFEDNAGVIINETGEPTGTLIKGPIAKQAVERFPTVGKLASIII